MMFFLDALTAFRMLFLLHTPQTTIAAWDYYSFFLTAERAGIFEEICSDKTVQIGWNVRIIVDCPSGRKIHEEGRITKIRFRARIPVVIDQNYPFLTWAELEVGE